MAAIFLEGFDKYGPPNVNSVGVMLTAGEWNAATVTCSIVAPLSATGQALQITHAGSFVLTKTLPASYPRLIGGFRFSASTLTAVANGMIFTDAGASQCTITINNTGTISLRTGSYTGAALATSSTSVTTGSTHYLEWDITFSNTGAYQVWLDGVSLFSGTGDTTNTANNTANGIRFDCNTGTGHIVIYDDLYIFDATGSTNNAPLLTSPRIETTFPASDSAVQFAFGAGMLGNQWSRATGTSTPAAGSLVLRRFIPGAACTLASITIVPGATSAGSNWRGVVYGDTSGAAGTLLSSGTQVTGVTANNAATLPLTTPQSLTGGTPYWLGFINDTAVAFQQSDGLSAGYRAANTYASGAPGTAPAMTSGQASYALWGNLTAVTGNWWESAQFPPPGGLSYVFDATVGHEDLYNFGALSVTPASVYAVAVKAYCQRSDGGVKTVSLRTKSGASDSGGTLAGQTPATAYGWVGSMFETDPQTGLAWTGAGLNAAQSGVKVDS